MGAVGQGKGRGSTLLHFSQVFLAWAAASGGSWVLSLCLWTWIHLNPWSSADAPGCTLETHPNNITLLNPPFCLHCLCAWRFLLKNARLGLLLPSPVSENINITLKCMLCSVPVPPCSRPVFSYSYFPTATTHSSVFWIFFTIYVSSKESKIAINKISARE